MYIFIDTDMRICQHKNVISMHRRQQCNQHCTADDRGRKIFVLGSQISLCVGIPLPSFHLYIDVLCPILPFFNWHCGKIFVLDIHL